MRAIEIYTDMVSRAHLLVLAPLYPSLFSCPPPLAPPAVFLVLLQDQVRAGVWGLPELLRADRILPQSQRPPPPYPPIPRPNQFSFA
jgi:hypothetical protein